MTRDKNILLASCLVFGFAGAGPVWAADEAAVVRTYVNIGAATFGDALSSAKALDAAIDALIADPTEATLVRARDAWKAARVPYMQSEVFRFGNPVVDEWEGRVNAWPLDEGLIDYVDESYGGESDANPFYALNVIAHPKLSVDGREIDASAITPAFLQSTLQEIGEVDTNVATGYHAIEFLLWGQDLNGTGPGAGNRPATDFDPKACTGGNCDRRAAYLKAAATLLVSDLQEMVGNWADDGVAAKRLLEGRPAEGLAAILTGMGSLSYGELAGERTKLGLMLHDPEEEHDCFSDNTFNSHYYDVLGIHNVYSGKYTRIDGTVVSGPSIDALLKDKAPDVEAELSGKVEAALAAATRLKARGETVEAYDQMIGENNPEGNATVQALVDGLVGQVPSIERAVTALGLNAIAFEGSDSLDNPSAVMQ